MRAAKLITPHVSFLIYYDSREGIFTLHPSILKNTLSEADKIRNKRLAKLSSQATSQSSSQPPLTSDPTRGQTTNPSTQLNSLSPQLESSQPAGNVSSAPGSLQPSPPLELQQSGPQGKRARISPPSTDVPPRPQSTPSLPPKRPTVKPEETLEAFEDRTLGALFKISLREDRQQDIHGQPLVYLPGIKDDLKEQEQGPRIEVGILDQALLEAVSNLGHQKPLDYLLPCWKRVQRLYKGFRKSREDDPKFTIVREARRLCVSYCIFAITLPDIFGLEPSDRSPLKPYLLLDTEDDSGIDFDLLSEFVKRFDEDEAVKLAFIAAVEEMSDDLATMTINDDYKPYVSALRNLVHHAAIASALTESDRFNASQMPAIFEQVTLLGPWFHLSPLQANVTTTYFSSPKTRDQAFILNSQRSLRMTQQMLSSDLLDVINHLIRASKDAREKVLDWFATALNINHKRRAMQVDSKTVSSDGFMFNLTTCLDQLCEPFMDAAFTKIDKIDLNYLHRNPRVDLRDETKINADKQASDEFYSKTVDGTSHFISEIFFLTVAAHHYGSESLTSKLEQLEKDLRHMESTINKFELERHKWAQNPIQLRTFEEALKKYKDKYDLGLSLKYSLQGVLFDETWQTRSMQFMRYVIVWLLRLVSGVNFPREKLKLPLPEDPSDVFRCLPEYFLDDIISNFKFIMWCMPQIITATQGDELVMLCTAFLESTQYIKNPYLKAGLVSILFRGTWPRPSGGRGVLVDLLNSMPFATEYLLHALMRFYIEAEFTGTHTQFFDKFNIRYEIFQIIKCVWPNLTYRSQLSDQAQQNLDFFVRFVNLLLNDVTFVLDESFTAFITIHDTQVELSQGGNSMDTNERQEKEEQLTAAQNRAKSYMQLTNETVAMLKLFTEALADSFTMPEIVQRLADMLDYNLDAMVGPKSSNLRVENLQEYGFSPRTLLSEIVDVYLNLMEKENFIFGVARDGRSYKPQNFEKAAEILRKWGLKSQEELQRWDELQKKVKAAKEMDDQAEEDLGDIPDEFLDPLIYTLMEDPIILPSSKVTIDRATIRSHLLSDPNDPFNRAPLKIEDVKPDTELKAKIEAFKSERKAVKRQALLQGAAENMDLSSG
ncbi:Ubiquitin elongating factor core domain containing protein [Elaphomyces granulatus]